MKFNALFLGIFISFFAKAQVKESQQTRFTTDSICNVLLSKNKNEYYYACGNTGRISENIQWYGTMIIYGSTSQWTSLLFDSLPINQYVASEYFLAKLDNQSIVLHDSVLNQISTLKKSAKSFYYCSGCTGHFSLRIGKLLSNDFKRKSPEKSFVKYFRKDLMYLLKL